MKPESIFSQKKRAFFPSGIKFLLLLIFCAAGKTFDAQVLTLKDALTIADSTSLQIKSAILKTEKNEMLEKTSFNLAQPQLQLQAPTGNFYTLGVQQNFDFPTVYSARKRWLENETHLSKMEEALTKAEVKYLVADMYLQWQVANAKQEYYARQLMMLDTIAAAAKRSYDAGEISFIEKTMAELKFQEATRLSSQMITEANNTKQALLSYLGAGEGMNCDTLGAGLESDYWTTETFRSAPQLAVAETRKEISQSQLQLQKQHNLPGFFIGYMNQGERNSPAENRLNAGISIPIWFWHQRAATKAAKIGVEESQKEYEAAQQEVARIYNAAVLDHNTSAASLQNIRSGSLPQSKSLADAAQRMRNAGEISLTDYIRLISEASQVELMHIELMQQLSQSKNQLQFLTSAQ